MGPLAGLRNRHDSALGVTISDQQHWGYGWTMAAHGWARVQLTFETRCHGFGMAYPRLFTAVYASDSTVWFQIGNERTDTAQIDSVTQTKDGPRCARYAVGLRDGSTKHVSLKFPVAVVTQRLIDPTYDELDSWTDDIMKTFPYAALDGHTSDETVDEWRRRIVDIWDQGFVHASEETAP